jgi:hypothetical protein
MRTGFKVLKDYLYQENKTFIIPNYQRGYKWAVKDGENLSAVEKLMDDLIKAHGGNVPSYFIQGITVSEDDNKIILIDGQQRTTTLYLLLWCVDPSHIQNIDLQYDIRKESKEYINNLKSNSQKENESNQDIFYFKQAIEQIQAYLQKKVDDKEEFLKYVLYNVQILYIIIEKEKAIKTFTMMNGSKATMLREELIKAEMLRQISLPSVEEKNVSTSIDENLAELKEIITKDWETNALRSRYAREWDKWLYWWNREDVQDLFSAKTPMGLLLEYYYKKTQQDEREFNFENFRERIKTLISTKKHFKGLRNLQKSFEDIFNTVKIHNYLGIALIDTSSEDKYNIISYFIENKKREEKLADYAKWRMVGATHRQITKAEKLQDDEETREIKAERTLQQLEDDCIYYSEKKDIANKQLLRLNVEEDNKLNRKFDFTIWHNKSLEHIHPKSKVYFAKREKGQTPVWKRGDDNLLSLDEKKEIIREINDLRSTEKSKRTWINRADFKKNGSEHCIGNLVLLYGRNNSKFGNKPFEEKKKAYFDTDEDFKSRHLLHTVSVFAEEHWGVSEIQANRKKFTDRFKKDYNIND